MSDTPNLLKAARWYAKDGKYVFPLIPGTKLPATPHACYDATTDLEQIERWWQENPQYNIGIHCGPSGLLNVDGDLYKRGAGSIDPYQVKTPTVDTAHGGKHLWYKMPEGKHYGNSRGSLPKWLDIRGYGGYVVAPPSVLVEDGKELPYTFVPGHKPTDIPIADLPAAIAAVLDAAQATSAAADIHFSEHIGAAPDLALWHLSSDTLDLIRKGHPAGCDRSSLDQSVITSLCYAGASNDEIRAVFVHYPIGGKYREKGRNGDKYLARSIGKARTFVEEHPPSQPDPTLLPDLHRLRDWVQSPELAELLREHKIKRPADYIKTLIAIVNHAIRRGASRIQLGSAKLGEMTNSSHMTAKRHLAMFGEGITTVHKDETVTHRPGLQLVTVTDDPAGYGKWVDLTQLLQSVNLSNRSSSVGGVNTLQQVSLQVVDEHLSDDAFVQYPRHLAQKMRPEAQILPHGLNAAALLIIAVLTECGELTRTAICQLTGLSEYTVGKMLRRMADMGLLLVWQGKPYRYELHPDFDGRLDDLRPLLPSYEISKRRGYVNAKARVRFTNLLLTAPDPPDDRTEAKLKNRRAQCEKKQQELVEAAAQNGVDIAVTLRTLKPVDEQVNHAAHLDRLRTIGRTGERAMHRAPRRSEDDKAWIESQKFAELLAMCGELWPEFDAWACMQQGEGWWVALDEVAIADKFQIYKHECTLMPLWARQAVPA